jgi:hypothetical protein
MRAGQNNADTKSAWSRASGAGRREQESCKIAERGFARNKMNMPFVDAERGGFLE